MLAPKVAKSQTKAAAPAKNSLAHSSAVAHQLVHGPAEQALPYQSSSPLASWDFNKIPVFPPDQPQVPSPLIPQRAVGREPLQIQRSAEQHLPDRSPNDDRRQANEGARCDTPCSAPCCTGVREEDIPLQLQRRGGVHTSPQRNSEHTEGKDIGKSASGLIDVDAPGDPREVEANAVADQIASTARPNTPGAFDQAVATAPQIGSRLRPQPGHAQRIVAPPEVGEVLKSPGQKLPEATRAAFEPAFGKSFAEVRIHADALAANSAAALHASAYTAGNHIVFGAGRFAPDTGIGRRLLSHELVHVVQQSGASGSIQRGPEDPPSRSVQAGSVDIDLEGLQVAGGALNLALDVLSGEPLTAEEMWELLLVRRAEPLSIPASEVNAAGEKLKELTAKIAALDKKIQDLEAETGKLESQRRRARGFPREMIRREIDKLQAEGKKLAPQRKKLLADSVRLKRGQALGTIGAGAPAGTGQITYAGIQVVDASGKRIAIEFAETSATEHAEERIIGRLRAALTPDKLKGAHIIVVADQKVCGPRCQRALVAFAKQFEVESVVAKRFVRPKIGKPGEASSRTTLRTATKPTSADLPLREITEEIYRRSPSGTKPPGAKPSGAEPPPAAPKIVPADAPSAKTTKSMTEPDAESSRRPTTGGEPYHPKVRARVGTVAEAGGNLIVDLILDLILMKFQQWRSDKALRERLEALQPAIQMKKLQALHAFLSDPWASGTSGFYYNVVLRITSTTTTAIGGGHAVVLSGRPRPEIVQVTITSTNANQLLSEDEAIRLFHLSEGATGAVYQHSDTTLVVYSEPLQ